ncbi:MAG: DUF4198 domain-containing protein [Gemmatimonadota bacterium]
MRRRTTAAALAAVGVLALVGVLQAHDMFLKLESYFLPSDATVSVQLLNGTFEQSENAIARDRMTDVSVVGPGSDDVSHPSTSRWTDSANAAVLRTETGDPGTYVVGVSTAERTFTLSGEDFDGYLEHDGVLDVLEARREAGEMGTETTETYSKHVKAVVQVGEARSEAYAKRLGYPVELVPLQNPYDLSAGDTLELRFLSEGRPVSDQIVYAGYEGYEAGAGAGEHRDPVQTRTDDGGIARIPLERAGKWYVRVIHMVRVPDDPEVDYESNWATVSFEMR